MEGKRRVSLTGNDSRNPTMKEVICRLQRIFSGDPIVIVSGLPRSGTSMVMQMLKAGGIEAGTDETRGNDEDNPLGYFELERVKELDRGGDRGWLKAYRGKAIKVISYLLRYLPPRFKYRIIFIERDLEEVLISQKNMLLRRGEHQKETDDKRLREDFSRHLHQVRALLKIRPNCEVLYLDHRSILSQPEAAADRINRYLGGRLDVAAMTAAVDRKLYRSRGRRS